MTHGFVRCVRHAAESGAEHIVELSLGQRVAQTGVFDYVTVWTLAREMIQAGAKHVEVELLTHDSDSYCRVAVSPSDVKFAV